ncbi:hypothetical protein LCGC14_1380090 [marine sediment metagenome]|uniref:Uncharacterized protein n=1 Tax=marine sediment metagenome TaxID=412755 RepID=A0A0F9K3C7_9ZZZZ
MNKIKLAFVIVALLSLVLSGCTYHQPTTEEIRYYSIEYLHNYRTNKCYKTIRWNDGLWIFTRHVKYEEISCDDALLKDHNQHSIGGDRQW